MEGGSGHECSLRKPRWLMRCWWWRSSQKGMWGLGKASFLLPGCADSVNWRKPLLLPHHRAHLVLNDSGQPGKAWLRVEPWRRQWPQKRFQPHNRLSFVMHWVVNQNKPQVNHSVSLASGCPEYVLQGMRHQRSLSLRLQSHWRFITSGCSLRPSREKWPNP